MPNTLHMTNTVFIDRAIIVQPFMTNEIPDELSGLEFANSSMPRLGDSKLPDYVTNSTENGTIVTTDESLADQGLPLFPPLPGDTDEKTVEEIRRTVRVDTWDLKSQPLFDDGIVGGCDGYCSRHQFPGGGGHFHHRSGGGEVLPLVLQGGL